MENDVNPETASQDEEEIREHPLYREGMSYLQVGAWDEAIRCFTELHNDYPDSSLVQESLDETRFKAGFDEGPRIKAKRWTPPRWRAAVFRVLIVIVIAVLAVFGIRAVIRGIQPYLQRAQHEQDEQTLLAEAQAYLEAGDLDAAEAHFLALLELDSGNQAALDGLEQISEVRSLQAMYERAVEKQEAGDALGALALFNVLQEQAPRYRDVEVRIEQIERNLALDDLFAAAEQDYRLNHREEAIEKFEEIRSRNLNYQQDIVMERLFDLYMQSGFTLVRQNPPVLEDLPEALEYFTQALSIRPRDTDAKLEQKLVRSFLQGQSEYYAGQWDAAIVRLQEIYDLRPGYLDDMVLYMLYDAYMQSGEAYREAGDFALAYERYRRAADLPVDDAAWAKGRLAFVEPKLTPTPTPRPTPTPKPDTGGGGGTPRPPLNTYHNKIVFYSTYNGYPELWVMNPDGKNRQALGSNFSLLQQYNDLVEQAQYSPDGSQFLFVQDVYVAHLDEFRAQIFVTQPGQGQFGSVPPTQLTDINGIAYSPAWSPDGVKIVYVGQEVQRSDDIFIMNADGSDARRLVENDWEWDKHPFWSPDGRQIVFWSNRTGVMQIFVMSPDGSNVKNISNTEWDEYDPIWIK
ncbi:MAG: PD40 domain-containing protein [Anaerolineae bacterium]|nr:PD40 domain-containing protein [Anaerolineae bacterium]